VPPTDDPGIIRYFTPSLQPEVVQEGDRGTTLSATLALARRTLESRPTPDARRAILVLSDGDVHEAEELLAGAASEAADAGFAVWVAGVGTQDGASIVLDGQPLQDVGGRPVVVGRNAELLRAVAAAGNGRYDDISDDAGLASLVAALRDLAGETDAGPGEPFDTTALLALLAIPLLLWESRLDAGTGSRRDAETAVESPS
jgi:Ca-activated chloride channel family protein